MKITIKQLKQLIKEELQKELREGHQGATDNKTKIVKDSKTEKYYIEVDGRREKKPYDTKEQAKASDAYAEFTTPGGDW